MSSHRVPAAVDPEPILSESAGVAEIDAALRRELSRRIRPEMFESWLAGVELVERDGPRCVFHTPSPFVRDWVRRNFLSELQSSLEGVMGRRDVQVVLRSGARSEGEAALEAVEVVSLVRTQSPADDPPAGRAPMPGDGAWESESSAAAAGAAGVEGDGEVELKTGGGAVPGSRSEERAPLDEQRHDWDSPDADGEQPRDGGAGEGAARDPQDSGAPQPDAPRSDESAARGGGYPARDPDSGAQDPRGADRAGSESSRPGPGAALNRNYTFETFVVGPCNRLSHAAALAVGDNPGRAYNPFFVHGNVGLGKTHVLQAVCHSIRRRNEDARVLYLSCEDFTNRFIHSIQRGELDRFREIHRGVDVLVIDDIQFLENKEKTQDEFFHTFNALYNTNRQIILSSDRPPSEIPTIEERLVSRFKWGLVAEMEVPCFETRVAIVKRKARLRQVEMPDEVAWFIAERIDTNIRELEGAVIKVVGIASITERPLTADLAEEALKGVVVSRSRRLSLGDVMGVVTGHFSVSARELTGKGRTQAVSLPRQICMYLCRQHTEQSLEEIGRFFGNRDHTTVIYAVQKIKKRVKEDRVFRELVGTLSSRLSG